MSRLPGAVRSPGACATCAAGLAASRNRSGWPDLCRGGTRSAAPVVHDQRVVVALGGVEPPAPVAPLPLALVPPAPPEPVAPLAAEPLPVLAPPVAPALPVLPAPDVPPAPGGVTEPGAVVPLLAGPVVPDPARPEPPAPEPEELEPDVEPVLLAPGWDDVLPLSLAESPRLHAAKVNEAATSRVKLHVRAKRLGFMGAPWDALLKGREGRRDLPNSRSPSLPGCDLLLLDPVGQGTDAVP